MKKIKKIGEVLSKQEMKSIHGANGMSGFCLSWTAFCTTGRDAKQCCSGLECKNNSCGFIDW